MKKNCCHQAIVDLDIGDSRISPRSKERLRRRCCFCGKLSDHLFSLLLLPPFTYINVFKVGAGGGGGYVHIYMMILPQHLVLFSFKSCHSSIRGKKVQKTQQTFESNACLLTMESRRSSSPSAAAVFLCDIIKLGDRVELRGHFFHLCLSLSKNLHPRDHSVVE